MKTYEPYTYITVRNDPQDFQMPFTIYSEYERDLYYYYYNRLTNAEISLLSKPVDITVGNFEEGAW